MIIHASDLTTTPLGAGAVFTGPTVDAGTEPTLWPTRTRPTVIHATAAKNAHGYLTLQESSDGVNFVETRRTPIPADGEAHTFDWPLHLRYRRLRFINGAQAQTAARISATAVRDDGGTMDEQEVLNFFLSNQPLGVGAAFTSPIFDLGANASRNTFRAFARSDQQSADVAFRIEWSVDGGVNFHPDRSAALTLPAGNYGNQIESRAAGRYCRVVYANGTTAQGAFMLGATLVSI